MNKIIFLVAIFSFVLPYNVLAVQNKTVEFERKQTFDWTQYKVTEIKYFDKYEKLKFPELLNKRVEISRHLFETYRKVFLEKPELRAKFGNYLQVINKARDLMNLNSINAKVTQNSLKQIQKEFIPVAIKKDPQFKESLKKSYGLRLFVVFKNVHVTYKLKIWKFS